MLKFRVLGDTSRKERDPPLSLRTSLLQIRAIDKKRLKKRIGTLKKKAMQDIDIMLKKMLQL